jgi:hypothetical protein
MMLGQVDRTMKLGPQVLPGYSLRCQGAGMRWWNISGLRQLKKKRWPLHFYCRQKGRYLYIWFWTSGSTFNGTDRYNQTILYKVQAPLGSCPMHLAGNLSDKEYYTYQKKPFR